jgi:hypothetical protein
MIGSSSDNDWVVQLTTYTLYIVWVFASWTFASYVFYLDILKYLPIRWLARDPATGSPTPSVLGHHTKAPPALLPGEIVALHLLEARAQVDETEIDTIRAVVDGPTTMMMILDGASGDIEIEKMIILVGIGNEARGVAGMTMIGTARAVGMMSGTEIGGLRDDMRTIGMVHRGIKAEIARGTGRGMAMIARRRIEG